MPSEQPQPAANPLLILIIIGAVFYFSTRGPSTPQPVQPEPDKPTPVVVEKPTADQCWDALAKCVENKWIGGTLQQHTDHLVKIVDSLKASGSITDDARVSDWRAKRVEITDSNRAQIAAKLRGK